MQKELINKPEIKLVGLTVRTNNTNETSPETAKIGALAMQYGEKDIATQIPNRSNTGVTLSIYTDYDSDEHGDYTYFIGEEVSSFDNTPDFMQQLTIPTSKYQKFTTPSGQMPNVVITAWKEIWGMETDEIGGERAYIADFEVYDQRASDPANTSLDIYIGIK